MPSHEHGLHPLAIGLGAFMYERPHTETPWKAVLLRPSEPIQ